MNQLGPRTGPVPGWLLISALILFLDAAAGLAAAPDEPVAYGPSVNLTDLSPYFPAARPVERLQLVAAALSQSLGTDIPLDGWNEPAIAVNPMDPLNIA